MRDQPDTVEEIATPVVEDCWNKIGVQGDGTCPELAKHIHCHNCPVYSAAAVALLDRPLPAGYLDEWTHHFAKEKSVVESEMLSVILFRLGGEWFALPVAILKEISEPKTIHSLPHRRNKIVLGLINSRGELLICVSLAETLGLGNASDFKPENHQADHSYFLIISHGGNRLAFPVDQVGGLHHFNAKEMKKVPATVSGVHLAYTKGVLTWQEKSVGYLDGEMLFYTLGKSVT